MPVSWRVEPAARRTLVTLSDPYSFPEWEETLAAMIDAGACEPWRAFLVDRRDAAAPTTDFVRRMADAFGRHAQKIGSARVAIVVSNDVNFGMARMTQMLAEAQTPFITIRAFRKFEEAERWLGQGTAVT
jgi:hypothetical protein